MKQLVLQSFRDHTISITVCCLSLLTFLLFVATVTGVNHYLFASHIEEQLYGTAKKVSLPIEDRIKEAMSWGANFKDAVQEQSGLYNYFSYPAFAGLLTEFAVVDLSDNVLLHSDMRRTGKGPLASFSFTKPENSNVRITESSYHVLLPLNYTEKRQGYIIVGFKRSTVDQFVHSTLSELRETTFWLSALGAVVFGLWCWGLCWKWIIQPTRRMQASMSDIARTGQAAILPGKYQYDEVGRFMREFNRLIEELYKKSEILSYQHPDLLRINDLLADLLATIEKTTKCLLDASHEKQELPLSLSIEQLEDCQKMLRYEIDEVGMIYNQHASTLLSHTPETQALLLGGKQLLEVARSYADYVEIYLDSLQRPDPKASNRRPALIN